MSTEAEIVTLKNKDGQVIAPRTTTGAVSDFPSIDTTPTSNSSNLITSGGVKSVVDLKANLTHASQHAVGGSDPLTPASIGALPLNPASIELTPAAGGNYGGYIDFHFNGSTADYTSRLIEGVSGGLTVTGGLAVGGALTTGGQSVIHAGNIGSQSVNYATTAGNSNAVYGYGSVSDLKNAMGVQSSPIMLGTGTITVDFPQSPSSCRISGVYNSVSVTGNTANPNQSPYLSVSTVSLITGGCSYIVISTNVGVYTIMAGNSGLIYYNTYSANIMLSANGVTLSSNTCSYGTAISGSFVAYRQN